MQFGLLGSLVVCNAAAEPVNIGGVQPRTVLAVLLAAEGRVVTSDALVDAVWGDRSPASASGTLQSYVSRLRRSLNGGQAALIFEPPGYRLDVVPDEVDFRRFEALADDGRRLLTAGQPSEARAALVEGLNLWRGSALAEFEDRPFASGLAARLEDLRLAALEDRLAADLALGRHAAVIGELNELVMAHPLREALRAHLALALYRSGRQADALRAIQAARQTLVEELGVDPGRTLQELEAAILNHDLGLELAGAPLSSPASSVATPPLPAPSPPAGPSGSLVGRMVEVSELLAVLDRAAVATRTVIIEGEPGIGKTRLAEELSASADERGATVLWGRAFEGGDAPALWPWLPPLRTLVEALPSGLSVPSELAGLLSPAGDGSTLAPAEPARFALVEAVEGLLKVSTQAAPIVLVLDDLQWADEVSLELLRYVAGRLRQLPLLLVCTVRELDVGRNDEVVQTLATLTRQPGTVRIRLTGLPESAIADLVVQTTGGRPPEDAVREICLRAEGNPFFAIELARLLATGERPGNVPSGVRDVVRRRLATLPEQTGELLRAAAVIGRETDLDLLVRATSRETDACLDDLEPALLQRLLSGVSDRPGAYRFAHALVREAVLDDVSSLKRARLHLQVADAMPESDDTAEIVAQHLWAAAPIGAGRRAADALERASTVAIRRLAYASAEQLLERAVQLRRTMNSGLADRVAEVRAITQLVAVVGARHGRVALLGSPLVARGRQVAEQTGQTHELLSLLWDEWAGLDIANRQVEADPIARSLLVLATGHPDPPSLVLGHTAFGISCWHRGEITEAAAHLDQAVAASGQVDPAVLPSALLGSDQMRLSIPFSLYLHDLIGDLDEPETRYEEAVRVVPGDRYWELLVRNFAASSALSAGQVDRAIRACRRGLAADPDGVSAFWSLAQRCYYGAALLMGGHLDEGLETFEPAWAAYREAGIRTNGASWTAIRTQALATAGRIEDAEHSYAETQNELRTYRERYAESTVLIAEGVLAQARGKDPASAFRRALAIARSQGAGAMAARVEREAAALAVDLSLDRTAVDIVE